jgi:methionyl-tRNA formyltransferase
MIRTIFMGTPEIAVPTLRALLTHPDFDVVGVVTQPDRKAGRGRKLKPSPVKEAALAAGVPAILQPARLRDPDAFQNLAALEPELIVVTAYGQILRPEVLDLPGHGCINVHASLLPRWRGASPITAAILAGDPQSGVTIMQMDPGMDTGPILTQRAESIRPDDTSASLGERLGRLGAELLIETLPCYIEGEIQPKPQPEAGVTLCRLVKKEHARIDWTRPAIEIERMVRAYQPWPGAFTTWQGQNLKIGAATAIEGEAEPGRVIAREKKAAVGTGSGLLIIDKAQLPGKKMLNIGDFLRGRPDLIGAKLGK